MARNEFAELDAFKADATPVQPEPTDFSELDAFTASDNQPAPAAPTDFTELDAFQVKPQAPEQPQTDFAELDAFKPSSVSQPITPEQLGIPAGKDPKAALRQSPLPRQSVQPQNHIQAGQPQTQPMTDSGVAGLSERSGPLAALKVGAAQAVGSAISGGRAFTPDSIDPFLKKAGDAVKGLASDEDIQTVSNTLNGALWPSREETPWYDIDASMIPSTLNTWASTITNNIPIMVMSHIGRSLGGKAGSAIAAAIAGAGGQAGPQAATPEEVVTVPAGVVGGNIIGSFIGGAAPLIGMEADGFLDAATYHGIDKDIAEKYARRYGVGSGVIEYGQQVLLLKSFKGIVPKSLTRVTTAAKKAVLVRLLGASAVEGLEELSQSALEAKFLKDAVAEQKQRDPTFKANLSPAQLKRSFAVGAGVGFATMGLGEVSTSMRQRMQQGKVEPEEVREQARVVIRDRQIEADAENQAKADAVLAEAQTPEERIAEAQMPARTRNESIEDAQARQELIDADAREAANIEEGRVAALDEIRESERLATIDRLKARAADARLVRLGKMRVKAFRKRYGNVTPEKAITESAEAEKAAPIKSLDQLDPGAFPDERSAAVAPAQPEVAPEAVVPPPAAPKNGITPAPKVAAEAGTTEISADARPALSYSDFAKQYRTAWQNVNKYKLDQAGSRIYTDEMAKLADENPEHLAKFEAEQERGIGARKQTPEQAIAVKAAQDEMRVVANRKYATPAERADAIAAAREKIQNVQAGIQSESAAQREADLAKRQGDILAPDEGASVAAKIVTGAKKAAKAIEGEAAKATKRMRTRNENRMMSGLDEKDMADATIIGADLVLKKFTEIGKWSNKMVSVIGERVRSSLSRIWKAVNSYLTRVPKYKTKLPEAKYDLPKVKVVQANAATAAKPTPATKSTERSTPLIPRDDTPAGQAQKVFDQQRQDIKDRGKWSFRKFLDTMGARFIDVDTKSARILENDEEGRAVMNYKRASRGASGEAEAQYTEAERSIEGELHKDLGFIKDAKARSRVNQMLSDYLQAKRTIEVSDLKRSDRSQLELFDEFVTEGLKSPTTPEQSRAWIEAARTAYPAEMARIEKASETFWGTMRSQVNQSRKAGLITKGASDFLLKVHKFYSPRLFIQHFDRAVNDSIGGRGMETDSGIKALDKGSEESLVNDWRLLLSQVVARTQSRVFKNRANEKLMNWAKNTPDNPLELRIQKPSGTDSKGKLTYAKPPTGMKAIPVFRNGAEMQLLAPDGVAKYWVSNDPKIANDLADIMGTVLGTKLLRLLATGINPEFAIANLPRDIVHSWFTTQEYSPIIPIAMAQQARDFTAVAKDVFKRTGRIRDSIREGMSMSFLTNQGSIGVKGLSERTKARHQSIASIHKFASYLGETSELWTRMALRERAIKNGKTPFEATQIARGYLDFSQGGSWTKAADKAIPYLNAGVQGTRGIFRAFKENPKVAALKTAQVMGFAMALAYWNRKTNEEAWDEVSEREKVSKWIFTTPIKRKDEDGNTRHVYLTIPKDQGQRVFATIAEELMEKNQTGTANYEKVRQALGDFLPVDAGNLIPPTVSAFLTYVMNKDFWRNEDVWKGRDVKPTEEYWMSTPEAFVKLGKATGLSPIRAERAVGKVIPYNPYTWLLGATWKAVSPNDVTVDKSLIGNLSKTPFARRVMRSTWPTPMKSTDRKALRELGVTPYYPNGKPKPPRLLAKEIKDAKRLENSERQRNDRLLDEYLVKQKLGQKVSFGSVLANVKTAKEYKRIIARRKSKMREAMTIRRS